MQTMMKKTLQTRTDKFGLLSIVITVASVWLFGFADDV